MAGCGFAGDNYTGDWLPFYATAVFLDRSKPYFVCPGVIVSDRQILVTLDCVELAREGRTFRVFVSVGGCEEVLSNTCPEKLHKASICENKKACYIENDGQGPYSRRRQYKHDYAVLILEKRMEFGERIQPVCLPKRNSRAIDSDCSVQDVSISKRRSLKVSYIAQFGVQKRECAEISCPQLLNSSICVGPLRRKEKAALICSHTDEADVTKHTLHGLYKRCLSYDDEIVFTDLTYDVGDIEELMGSCTDYGTNKFADIEPCD